MSYVDEERIVKALAEREADVVTQQAITDRLQELVDAEYDELRRLERRVSELRSVLVQRQREALR